MARLTKTRIQHGVGGVDVVVAPGEAATKIALLRIKHKGLIPLRHQHFLGEVEQRFVVGAIANAVLKQPLTSVQSPRLSRMFRPLIQGDKLQGYCRSHMKISHQVRVEATPHYHTTLDLKAIISLGRSSLNLEKIQ
jgi:hypothetical protein